MDDFYISTGTTTNSSTGIRFRYSVYSREPSVEREYKESLLHVNTLVIVNRLTLFYS